MSPLSSKFVSVRSLLILGVVSLLSVCVGGCGGESGAGKSGAGRSRSGLTNVYSQSAADTTGIPLEVPNPYE
ncbi:MAG TPA: hypothetical protein VN345_05115, partial [Blastocatellia bacterium]|nr:hypothetical protein [Blastocatellia bacterium]